jgi:hypothetical protein
MKRSGALALFFLLLALAAAGGAALLVLFIVLLLVRAVTVLLLVVTLILPALLVRARVLFVGHYRCPPAEVKSTPEMQIAGRKKVIQNLSTA